MTPLIRFTVAWALGIWLAQILPWPTVWLTVLIPPGLALLVAWGDRRWARAVAGVMIGVSLGGLRAALAQPSIGPHHVAFYRDRGSVTISGVVIQDADRRVKDVRLRVRVDEITLPNEPARAVEGRVLVHASPYAEVRYGDRVVVSGPLTTPPKYEAFDYREYLAHQGIFALMREGSISVVASHQGNPLLDYLFQFRDRAYAVLSALLPEPQGALLAGILLGLEHGMPEELTEAFAATGTTHIVAISGFNLTLAAGMVMQFVRRFFQRRGRLPVALGTIWLYVLLVGASPAVARAGVMSSLLVLAQQEQRPVHGPTSLAAAVLALSVWNPFILWDLGFQLSAGATLGMMLYLPPMTRSLTELLDRFIHGERLKRMILGIGDAMLVTLAVQIMTLGITVAGFGTLSLIAPLTNQLILPVQSIIMCFGFLALVTGLMLRPVGVLFAWITWVFLVYTTLVVEWTASLPYASIALESVPLVWIWGYYLLLGVATVWFGLPKPSRERIGAKLLDLDYRLLTGTGAVVVLLVLYGLQRPDGRLHVVFLDVGHGDAVYVQTPSGRQALIDGGSDPRQTLTALGKRMPFWDRSLDLVVLSSPDADRLAGLVAVLERYDVALVATSPEVGTGEVYARWEALLAARPAGSWGRLLAGDTWELDTDVALNVLWPPGERDGPCVLQLVHGEVSFLLMGDATTRVEDELITDRDVVLRSQVLQLPRQGDDSCCMAPFLQAVQPELAVVGRSGDRPLAPHLAARLMDVPLYITGRHGTLELISDGIAIRVRSRR